MAAAVRNGASSPVTSEREIHFLRSLDDEGIGLVGAAVGSIEAPAAQARCVSSDGTARPPCPGRSQCADVAAPRRRKEAKTMNDELVFYTNPMSRGRVVRWMLEEVGAPYRTELLAYGTTMKAPEYLAINPMGKVPALVHRGQVVTECAAICAYLADAFPEAGLAPPQGQRAAYYRWLLFAAGPVEMAVTHRSLGIEVPADKQGVVGYGSYEAVMDALESAVAGDGYIAGERFSAADVYLGAQIGWGLQFGTIEKRPAIEAYWARLSEREARQRATRLDDAAMAAQGG
jgi:glutathione S-transferase